MARRKNRGALARSITRPLWLLLHFVLNLAVRLVFWSLIRTFRAPLTSAGLMVLLTGSVVTTTNALYAQPQRHPAPLFGAPVAPERQVEATKAPASFTAPAQRVNPPAPTPVQMEVAAADPAPEMKPGANPDVFAVQQKLAELKLFDGTIDGFYGPRTATAIRAFEMRTGLTPQGAITPEIVKAIRDFNEAAVTDPPAPSLTPDPVQTAGTQIAQPLPEAQTVLPETLVAADSGPPAASIGDPVGQIAESARQRRSGGSNRQVADPELVARVQRGLASLGFLYGAIDGVAGEATAKAIRNFEVYHNYDVTGSVTPELVDLLASAGATL